jgi:hypothetical protein
MIAGLGDCMLDVALRTECNTGVSHCFLQAWASLGDRSNNRTTVEARRATSGLSQDNLDWALLESAGLWQPNAALHLCDSVPGDDAGTIRPVIEDVPD